MNGYIISALVERGVDKNIAQKLVKNNVIEQPINVNTLSNKDISKIIELMDWLEERGELELTNN